LITRTSLFRGTTLCLAGVVVALSLWWGVVSHDFPTMATMMAMLSVEFAWRNKRDYGTWIILTTLFPLPAAIAAIILDTRRRKALGLKWNQADEGPSFWLTQLRRLSRHNES
jgi:hypothetical protein